MKINQSQTIRKILKEFDEKFKVSPEEWDYKETVAQFLTDKLQEIEREKIILRTDLARAIGRMQGLGYPDKYLEKRYPELSHLKSGEDELSCGCPMFDENSMCVNQEHIDCYCHRQNGPDKHLYQVFACSHCKAESA